MRFNYKMLHNDESYEYLYLSSSFGVCLPPSDPIKHSETARELATGNIPITVFQIAGTSLAGNGESCPEYQLDQVVAEWR